MDEEFNSYSLKEIKNFLKIDFDSDDNYIKLLIEVAKEYIKNSIGEYKENDLRVKLLLLNIIASLYENRLYTIDKSNEKVAYVINNIALQLRLEAECNE